MPKGYVILTEQIHDQELMDKYSAASAAAVVESKAKILSVETAPRVLEGEWSCTRTVLLEFESVEAAQAWYDSPTYQSVVHMRHAASDCNLAILGGFDRPLLKPPA